ncbi:hypothetical protein BaRGS_00035466, partial [Batillaria attramentaria]
GSNLSGFMSADSAAVPDKTMVPYLGHRQDGQREVNIVHNTILGTDVFTTGRGMGTMTSQTQHSNAPRNGILVKVVDTPNIDELPVPLEEEMKLWKSLTTPYPNAILLTVRCDVRYTAEEYAIYQKIKQCWGESFNRRLVVAFTFGDRQDRNLSQELETVCPELKSVLHDAKERYVVFNNQVADKESQAEELLKIINFMEVQKEEPEGFDTQEWVLLGVAVASGLVFAAFLTADMGVPAALFGVTCGASGIGLAALHIYKKLRNQ